MFITRNRSFKIFIAETAETFKLWYHVTRRYLILSNFIKNYDTIKLIGKGSFAKVALCVDH